MRIAPNLMKKGLSEAHAVAATSDLMALFVAEKADNAATTSSSPDELEEAEKSAHAKKGAKKEHQLETIEELPSSAPLVLGEREIEALTEVAYAYAKYGAGHDLRKLFEGKGKRQRVWPTCQGD